jgi:hypothetical protein
MTDIIKAMNPTATLDTEEAALAAAKVSAVGVVIGAINSAVTGWYASTPEGSAALAQAMESLTGQAPDPGQAQTGLYFTGALVVLQLILAAVQWLKPNSIIPILFLVLVVWGLGSAILSLTVPAFGGSQPMWLTVFTLVAMLLAAIMHIAGIRGASALAKFREARAY